jgi:hypothetical protein
MNAVAEGTVFYPDAAVARKPANNSTPYDVVRSSATGQHLWLFGVIKEDETEIPYEIPARNTVGYVHMCGDPFRDPRKSVFRANPFCGTCLYEPQRDEPKLSWLGLRVSRPPRDVNPTRLRYVQDRSGVEYVLADSVAPPSKRSDVESGQERRAIQEVAKAIQRLLPGMSEASVGSLVGVSRIAWRGWVQGVSVPRAAKRRRLLRLKKVLELRRRVAPSEALTNWLETPVGLDLNVTPARLLAADRDQVVAALAARSRAPEGDEFVLEAPLDLGGLVDPDQVDEALRMRREIAEETLGM